MNTREAYKWTTMVYQEYTTNNKIIENK